jgi:hypothetical protein
MFKHLSQIVHLNLFVEYACMFSEETEEKKTIQEKKNRKFLSLSKCVSVWFSRSRQRKKERKKERKKLASKETNKERT